MTSAIWTEKYRPKDFSEIEGQKNIVKRVSSFVKQKNMPHLLFAGPPGVGKTTLSLIIAYKLFGDSWRQNFLELNASVAGDTPILIRKDGKIKRTNFNELDKEYFKESDCQSRKIVNNIDILSLDKKNYDIKFSKVNYIFRHKINKIVNIKYEGGKIKTSLNHSVIVFDDKGNLVEKKSEDLKKGDLLITFKTELEGKNTNLDLKDYKLQESNLLRSGLVKNPKINHNIDEIYLDNNVGWVLGLYAAEGCTSLKNDTSGQVIFTLGYPQEEAMVDKAKTIFSDLNISTYQCLGKSGFDRSKESSIQLRVLSTQLARFLRNSFYNKEAQKIAKNKRFFSQIFDADVKQRLTFLKGYSDGDGSGQWDDFIRISSRSKDCLIDAVWLSKLSGIESSYFDTEARLIWNNPRFSYIKSDLLPADMFINILSNKKGESNGNLTYILRHQLYSKKSKRIKKDIAEQILEHIKDSELKEKLRMLIQSDLYVLKITDIKIEDYNGYVYDVSVPESQMFFGGVNPILLHNSDERGIDVVRNTVKDFARTKAIGDVPFKIICLDECDALTKEAQQALRRTMENYSQTCRFILSCNYSSKIIEPIQSRCAIFRFRPLEKKDVEGIVNNIAENEKLKVEEKAVNALYEISEGDCRMVENILQSCATFGKEITEELIYSLVSAAKPKEVKEVLNIALKGDFIKARDKLLDTMLNHGLSGLDIIKQIQKEVWMLDIEDEKKVMLIEKCGEIEFRMVEGSDEFVQLESLLANFVLAGNSK